MLHDNVNVPYWSAYSADMNTIAHLWGILTLQVERFVYDRFYHMLQQALFEEWKRIFFGQNQVTFGLGHCCTFYVKVYYFSTLIFSYINNLTIQLKNIS